MFPNIIMQWHLYIFTQGFMQWESHWPVLVIQYILTINVDVILFNTIIFRLN